MSEFSLSEVTYQSPAYNQTVALRHEILRAPIGLEFPIDELEIEAEHFHLACYANDQLAGCLVLVPISDEVVKMRQVSVAQGFQRRGVGRALVEFSETFARERGFRLMTLHARATAVDFYEKLGYERIGEEFIEVTLPHWEMQKPL